MTAFRIQTQVARFPHFLAWGKVVPLRPGPGFLIFPGPVEPRRFHVTLGASE